MIIIISLKNSNYPLFLDINTHKYAIPITIASMIIAVITPIKAVFNVNSEGLLPKAALIVIPIQYKQYFINSHIFISPKKYH